MVRRTSKAFNQYLVVNDAQHSYSAPGTPADNAVIEHWWADFKAIWIAHLPKAQTLLELEGQVREEITYSLKNLSQRREMTLPQRNTVLARPTNFYYLMCKLDRAQYP